MRILLALLVSAMLPLGAQRMDPAKWELTLESETAPAGSHVVARLTATMEEGWHLYSPTTPAGGPVPTTIELAKSPAIASYSLHQREPVTKFDPNFKIDTETYDGEAVFLFDVALAEGAQSGEVELEAKVRYQLCTDKLCLPPKRKTATATLTIDSAAAAPTVVIPAEFSGATGAAVAVKPETSAAPVTAAPATADEQGMLGFVLVAFGFGLAAIFTPCVFPMIPITMSFFLRQQTPDGQVAAPGIRRESVMQAAVFCLGIIFLFTALGLIATAFLGPFGVVQLGSNRWVNTFIAAVFLVFGLSLLGAFEITLPSGLLTKMDQASRRGGYLGTLVMGLTFSLTAFACVGPFVGTLLAASISGGGIRPLVGMLAFATGLASPFFFLAIFPAYLGKLPRSGGWLARVKVVLGFVILAAMFKYISNVDQVMQWDLLTRERFLAIWIVLFAMAGSYLLGLLRLEGVNPDDRMGVGRLLAGAAFLVFAFSLLPGMFGGRLGELDAYVPVAAGGGSAAVAGGGGQFEWMKNDYDGALAKAKAEGKLVFVNFTGYACTNCHWMKANMFSRSEIGQALGGFVLVELYTDGTDAASAQNQQLQETKFQTIAIPYYAIMDADGNVLATFPGLTRDAAEFLAFLQTPVRSS